MTPSSSSKNVFRHLSAGGAGDSVVQAASAEIAAPMISSTLTTVVVFLPLVLVAALPAPSSPRWP